MAYTNNNGQARVGVRIVPLSVVIPTISTLLDSYSGAAAAYSLRKLSATYTGSAIRVRRSSDNTEQNIGFDSGGNLDTVALSTFVGSGNGFVTTWYDQSGNSRNVAQTTAANQPRIVNTGAIELLNGKVCFSNYGQNQWLQLNSFGSNIASVFSFAMVGSVGNDSFRVALKFNPPSTGNNSKLQVNGFASLTSLEMQGSSSIYYSFPGVMNTTIPHIIQGTFNSTTSEFSVNNQTLLTGNAGPSTLNGIIIGADWNGAYPTSGKYQEVVVWGVNKSTDRSGINTSLNTYYSVYPNPTSVWNLLNAVYSADTTALTSLKTSLYAAYNGESNANDSFGANNGTAQGGLTYTTGKIGNAFQFNGSNAYVSLPNNSLNFTGDFSFSLWMNRKAAVNSYIFSNFYNGSTPYGYYLYISSGTISFLLGNGTSSPLCNISTALLGGNVWQLITITKTNNSVKMYVDGTLKNSATINGNVVYTTTHYPIIGASKYDSGSPVGFLENGCQIDAVNFWQKELTASEVSELYNSGNGAQYITDNFYKPTTNDALLVNNGTAVGGLTYGLGKVGTAFQFNGTNAYVQLPNNSFNFTGDFSASLWVNFPSMAWQNGQLIDNTCWDSSGSGTSGWRLYYLYGSLGFYIYRENGLVQLETYSLNQANVWYHIVITTSSSGMKIYLNGSLSVSNTSTTRPNYPNVVSTRLGASRFNTQFTTCKMDGLSVWQKTLTQAEVTELYNSGNGKQYPN